MDGKRRGLQPVLQRRAFLGYAVLRYTQAMNDRTWDEMLAEFRALGGIAENIRLGEGALGRGLFPVDQAKPIRIHIPENLLLSVADVRFDGGVFHIAPESGVGVREKAFLESYENIFS